MDGKDMNNFLAQRFNSEEKRITAKDDIKKDMNSGEVTSELLIRAMINHGNLSFSKAGIGQNSKVKIKLNGNITKEYDLYDVMNIMQEVVVTRVVDVFSNYRLAYLSEYDPEFKMPDKAPKNLVESRIRFINEATDRYMVDQGIRDTFLKEHDINPDDLDNNIEWVKLKADNKRLLYESNLIHSFIEAFLIINVYESAFRKSPLAEYSTRYKKGMQNFCMQALEECKWVDDDIPLLAFSTLFGKESSAMVDFADKYGMKPLSDSEVILCIENYLKKEDFEEFVTKYGDCILDRKAVIEYMTNPKNSLNDHSKAGLMSYDEFQQKVSKHNLDNRYLATHNRDLIKYMTQEQIVRLYADGELEDRDLRRAVRPGDILNLPIDKEIKIAALKRGGNGRVFLGKFSEKIWAMFEDGEFSVDDIKKLEIADYFNVDTIVKQYIENSKRKIANELGVMPRVSEEKIYAFFTPDIILREFSKIKNDEVQNFIEQTLKEIYEKHNQDMEEEIASELVNGEKTDPIQKCLLLYGAGVVSIDIFKKVGISKEEAVDICRENSGDERLLIDMFNIELVSQDDMIDILGDNFDEIVFDYIKKGMSARIIEGYYTTSQLIEMTREIYDEDEKGGPAKLTYENLTEIKSDIETGIDEKGMTLKGKSRTTLLDLYLSDKLSYSELYDLVKANVISMDVANLINEKYSLIKDWDKLKEKGVEGKSILDITNPTTVLSPIGSGEVVGIDEDCIIDFYIAMGAKEYLEIDSKQCPVFKDYMVIPIIEKKVAYLESTDGRTYIVPLKIVLEQINNPNGQMDLIGNARSRKEFNRQKAHIRSANHTRNWGRKVVQKTAELPSVPMSKEDAKDFISTHYWIINAIESSYDSRKLDIIKKNSGHQNP